VRAVWARGDLAMISIFSGGVRLEQKKSRTMKNRIETLPAPKIIAVPLPGAQTSAQRCVREGDVVLRYSQLSMPIRNVAVCAPAGGKVLGIRAMPHPVSGTVDCAVIETDEAAGEIRLESPGMGAEPDEIIRLSAAAGIIDEYDGIPLFKKLKRFRRLKIDWLAANVLDDEPYVCSGLAVLKENRAAVRAELELAAAACGASERKIAVASEMRARHYARISGAESDMLVSGGGIYPAWPRLLREQQLHGRRPGLIGVQALAALYEAVEQGRPQVSTVVTVSGEGAKEWKNLRVLLGTPVGELLAACGAEKDAVAVAGSPITGGVVTDPETPVTADTRCLVVLPADAPEKKVFPCIGCGRCARVCPMRILPWYLQRQLQENRYPDPQKLYRAEKCCRCNACSVVCPSGLSPAEAVARAAEIKERG